MEPFSITRLLEQQRALQFADVAGAHASIELPISDRLVNQLIAEYLPSSGPIRQLAVVAETGNRMTVHVKLAHPPFLPPFRIALLIEQQPVLPNSPVIGLRMMSAGLAALAGIARRFVEFLPPGVTLDRDRVIVNLATLLAERGASDALTFVTHLELKTLEGRFIVAARAALPPRLFGDL